MAKNRRRSQKKRNERSRRQVIQIDVLPDDVLLEIFDFYMVLSPENDKTAIEAWQPLVHVCRRWRYLVFGSPRRLNLRLLCTVERPTRDTLDVWPALPLVVEGSTAITPGTDNIIAALGQSDRVCKVELSLGGQELEEVLAAMQVPFPELTQMVLSSDDDSETALVIPDSFLGGSAPRLRTLSLKCIPFPALPKLLLSSTHLVKLCLSEIPHSGYISPEVMVALLPVLSSLKALYLKFRSPESRPVSESRSLPSIKRSILPALTSFDFQGATEYLEELVANIDTPQLNELDITLFNQIGTPRLAQFINRTSLTAGDIAGVAFYGLKVQALVRNLRISILCPEPDRQFSSVTQIYKPLRTLSTVANLQILNDTDEHTVVDAIEDTLWLQLLLPFTALKNLYLPREFAPSIAAALKELVGRRKIEVLLSLENIFVKGFVPYRPLQEIFDQFVAARQLSEHPIAISAGTSGSDAAPAQEALDVA